MRRVPLSALNRKLIRDVWGMKGQALAIALVIAAGIAMYVSYLSNFQSLSRARDRYYVQQRFADVFATVVRAPEWVRDRLADVPGVEDVETRVVTDVVLDVPGVAEPASGRLISIPSAGEPRLNALYLRLGRWVSPDRPDEVIASEDFVQANSFRLGDTVGAVINGRQRRLVIVGVALSPEYLFSTRPGELVPDPRRYGIFWMGREALAGAFEMEGGFNDVSFSLAADAVPEAAAAEIDRLLAPYGGRGATLRALQFSNWSLESELGQLSSFGFFVPLLFLLVAAFVLNIALTRALALQRPQLAALKALGYRNRELVWHYVKWALVIALAGACLGLLGGAWMGAAMSGLYNAYFKFPVMTYWLSPGVVVGGVIIALVGAGAGALTAVLRAVRVAPAEAMRPESPTRYRRSVVEWAWLRRRISTVPRMILRNLERQPMRAATTVMGIALAGAIMQVGLGLMGAMESLILTQFTVAERQHMTVTFVRPVSGDAVHALARLPGVLHVEPQRVTAVRLRAGHHERTLPLIGLPASPDLKRPITRRGEVILPPAEGLVLSSILGQTLALQPGDAVSVELLEGSRASEVLPVARFVDDVFGISAYMEKNALHRLLGEQGSVSGAELLVDAREEARLVAALKAVPAVAGVASKRLMLTNFRRMLDENMGVMMTFNVLFAAIIAFGVVYNAARVSLSERSRELASLRVLGFTRAEISLILVGELALLTVAALPVGALAGHGLTWLLVYGVESEMYRFPLVVSWPVVATAALTVVVASLVSSLVVRRQLDRLDLVGVLKLRE